MNKIFIPLFCFLFSCFFMIAAYGLPKITTTYGFNLEGFVRGKVKNETREVLACYIAIDGYKVKFRLPAFSESPWVTATDKRLTHKSFSTWCDYIEHHPEYLNYKLI